MVELSAHSSVWQNACFGSKRPQVQILLRRPILKGDMKTLMQKIIFGFFCVWFGCMITMMAVIARDLLTMQDDMDSILLTLDESRLSLEQLNIMLEQTKVPE